MDEAMKIADCTYTSSQIGNFFKQFLRQKNKEVQREAEREQRNITPRVVSSRKRKRTMVGASDQDVQETEN